MTATRELTARRRDGSEVPVEIGLSPIPARGQSLLLAALVDLTGRHELRQKQAQLEHIARVSTMGEIAASLAHELSQPLTAILTNAQAGLRFLARGEADPGEIRAILEDVVADDRRAGEVVGALRAMLRRGKPETALVDAAGVVREILPILNSELVARQIEVETALEEGSFVLANRTQLEQVVINLVMNAVDAMRAAPRGERCLRIEVARPDARTVRVAVRDSGIGIPADEVEKVFEAFWTTKPTGMGMGLTVCASIVKSCGGELGVRPNPDRGVTFFFILPVGQAGAAGTGNDGRAASPHAGRRTMETSEVHDTGRAAPPAA